MVNLKIHENSILKLADEFSTIEFFALQRNTCDVLITLRVTDLHILNVMNDKISLSYDDSRVVRKTHIFS